MAPLIDDSLQVLPRRVAQLLAALGADAELAPYAGPLSVPVVVLAYHARHGVEIVPAPDEGRVPGVAVAVFLRDRRRNGRGRLLGERDERWGGWSGRAGG